MHGFTTKLYSFRIESPFLFAGSFPLYLPFPELLLSNLSCFPPFSPFLPRPWLWKYGSLSVFFTCSFPRLSHCASVQMNMSAQAMSLPPLRKSSWAQQRPRGSFTTAVHTQNTIIDNLTSNFNDCIWYWKTNKKKRLRLKTEIYFFTSFHKPTAFFF